MAYPPDPVEVNVPPPTSSAAKLGGEPTSTGLVPKDSAANAQPVEQLAARRRDIDG